MNPTDPIHSSTASMYFVAVVCPDEINQKVLSFKHWMRDQFNCIVALKSPAHITLIPPFWIKKEEEVHLITQLQSLNNRREVLTIQLNGFSHFSNRVLFVQVVENTTLVQLKSAVETHFTIAFPGIIKKENRPFHPHVTIANRDLSPAAFMKAWARFSKENFHATFSTHTISLLKLVESKWNVVASCNFQ